MPCQEVWSSSVCHLEPWKGFLWVLFICFSGHSFIRFSFLSSSLASLLCYFPPSIYSHSLCLFLYFFPENSNCCFINLLCFTLTWGLFLIHCTHNSVSKESACNSGDQGSILGLGRSPGEENGTPLQYSCLENFMNRRAWKVTVQGVEKNQTWLSIALTLLQNSDRLIERLQWGGLQISLVRESVLMNWSYLILRSES